jgi:hypothetical protein
MVVSIMRRNEVKSKLWGDSFFNIPNNNKFMILPMIKNVHLYSLV